MTGPLLVTGGTGLLGSAVLALRPDAVGVSQADWGSPRSISHGTALQ